MLAMDGKELSNVEIELYLRDVPGFVGVFSKDNLPFDRGDRTGGYVLNMQGSHEGNRQGSHWVAFVITHKGGSLYFDPLGVRYPPEEVLKFCPAPMQVNNTQMEALGDTDCGQWCVWFIRQILFKRRAFKSVIEHFHLNQDLKKSDIWLNHHFLG